ncbi:uncharacterized protein LOC113549676 [Rhopalosiphum maidis]|uniref:uncharacterized protein LOC113549676 n=1 Tax=Rhopalosiphum maidis TaxID=43146 RepID=UPI000EFF365C|nr:uncharacterized protein LOC113549676 [Rhopalosiphum maidis]
MNLFLTNSLIMLLLSCIESNAFNIFTKLPLGPYKLIFKHIGKCNDSSQNNKIQHHLYLSQNPKSNVTEIKGYTNSSVPFDDTLFLEVTFSFKDADGSWKDNTLYHKSPKGCSSFKYLLGASWTAIMEGLGIKNVTCPISPGIYTATGVDTSLLSNANLPKTFVYGTYKIQQYYTLKREVYSCIILIVEFKPV